MKRSWRPFVMRSDLWDDAKLAAHAELRDRWFALSVVGALAIGIGVATTAFSLFDGFLLRELPVANPDRIVAVVERDTRNPSSGVSYPDYVDWVTGGIRAFKAMGIFSNGTLNVSESDRPPERLLGPYISASAFDLLGVKSMMGRGLHAADDAADAAPVAVLSYDVWVRRYQRDPSVIGRVIKVNEELTTIVGVMAQGMRFPINSDLWLPFSRLPAARRNAARNIRTFSVFGLLADGMSIDAASAELASIGARLAAEHPDTNKDISIHVSRFRDLYVGSFFRTICYAILAASALVLLIVWANVGNLILVRTVRREADLRVRQLLGATRFRAMRPLVLGVVMLSLVGCVAAFIVARTGLSLLAPIIEPAGLPFWVGVSFNPMVAAFFLSISLCSILLFVVATLISGRLGAGNLGITKAGRAAIGSRGERKWIRFVIASELAVTLVMLAAAAFLMHSFARVAAMTRFGDTSQVLTLRMVLPVRKYPTAELRMKFYDVLEERVAALQSVESVAIASDGPICCAQRQPIAVDEGDPADPALKSSEAIVVGITPSYFRVLGIPLQAGDGLSSSDQRGNTAVVNQRFIALFFPNQNPVGRLVRVGRRGAEVRASDWITIVGVVPNIRQSGDINSLDPDAVVYVTLRPELPAPSLLLVRTRVPPALLAQTLRHEVASIDSDLPLFDIRTMDDRLRQFTWLWRTFGSMLTAISLTGLVLAAIGIYAVTAWSARDRTREIGLRMALGAHPRHVCWMMTKYTTVACAVGTIVGIVGGSGVGKILESNSILVQIRGTDSVTLASAALALSITAILASIIPARRASKLDPATALRYE